MQHFMDSPATESNALGLTISMKKTAVMYQPSPDKAYTKANHVWVEIKGYGKFMYLGNTYIRQILLMMKSPL